MGLIVTNVTNRYQGRAYDVEAEACHRGDELGGGKPEVYQTDRRRKEGGSMTPVPSTEGIVKYRFSLARACMRNTRKSRYRRYAVLISRVEGLE